MCFRHVDAIGVGLVLEVSESVSPKPFVIGAEIGWLVDGETWDTAGDLTSNVSGDVSVTEVPEHPTRNPITMLTDIILMRM